MILTVTINPLLERRFQIHKLIRGENHRSQSASFDAGGKGINVSRQLNYLNTENLAYTFLGGTNGKMLKNLLSEEKINFTFVQTKNETREGVVIIEEGGRPVTTIFGSNQILSENEIDEFKNKLRKIIENCEIVVFSGSSPAEIADDIFPMGIEIAHEFDKISILDTYGSHLKKCLAKSPTIIHNNKSELSSSLKIDLSDEQRMVSFLHQLYDSGIKQAYITDGSNPVYASNFDFIYKTDVPKTDEIDSTGSGDAFTAGIAYGLHNSLSFDDTLRCGLSLGVLNASRSSVCRVSLEEINSTSEKFIITTVGKKLKTLEK